MASTAAEAPAPRRGRGAGATGSARHPPRRRRRDRASPRFPGGGRRPSADAALDEGLEVVALLDVVRLVVGERLLLAVLLDDPERVARRDSELALQLRHLRRSALNLQRPRLARAGVL